MKDFRTKGFKIVNRPVAIYGFLGLVRSRTDLAVSFFFVWITLLTSLGVRSPLRTMVLQDKRFFLLSENYLTLY